MKYLEFSACERFGMDPSVFRRKSLEDQVELLAYEMIRNREERGGANPQ